MFFLLFESHRRKAWQTVKAGGWSINILQGLALKETGKGLSRATLLPLGKGYPQPSAHAPSLEHRGSDRDPLLPLPGCQQTTTVSIWPDSPWAISWVASFYLDQTVACGQANGHAVGEGWVLAVCLLKVCGCFSSKWGRYRLSDKEYYQF